MTLSIFDFESAIKADAIESWTVSAHSDKINPGDKVILWLTGPESGCYALAEITSQPFERKPSSDDTFYKKEDKSEWQVAIGITHNLIDKPILAKDVKGIDALKNLKAGNQGTNFTATKAEYEPLFILAGGSEIDKRRYWIYAPGTNADHWDEFYEESLMALGWDFLGDLNQYHSKDEIENKLKEHKNVSTSKKNDATANYEFKFIMNPGDIVIAKKGRTELLGYGIVTSDYYFDITQPNLKHRREVEWRKKGRWPLEYSLPLKTLTDVSDYPTEHPGYDKYYMRLLGEMNVSSEKINSTLISTRNILPPLNTILYGPPGTGKTYNTINHAVSIIENKNIDTLNKEDRSEIKNRFDRYTNEGRIKFITFHQSLSYEDFIEGIKPVEPEKEGDPIIYRIEYGLLKKIMH